MPATFSQATSAATHRLAWSAAVVLAFAACADNEATAPSSGQTTTLAASLAAARATSKVQRLERIRNRLSSGIQALFPSQKRSATSGVRLPLGRGRGGGAPSSLADVLVNDRGQPGLLQSEVTIADHGGTIVLGWNDGAGVTPDLNFEAGLTGWGFSPDGGRTFIDGGSLPRISSPFFIHLGDPGLAAGNDGTFFFSDICLDFGTDPILSGICVSAGGRHGRTIGWSTPIYAVSTKPDFLDKPFIATDRQGQDVYLSYTRFLGGGGFGQIELVASHDGGHTFGAPVVVQPELPATVNQGSEPAVGPKGEVYVVWERGWQVSGGQFPFFTPDIVISKSTDQGRTFGPAVLIQTITSIAFDPPSGYSRNIINDFPRIDVARTGPDRGEVYVVFHDARAGTADVYLSHSPDGVSWSEPVRVNDDPADFQFWPAVSVEPGGNVDVVWYDRRLNPGTPVTNTFWSQSTDGGETFRPNVRVSDVGSDWAATVFDPGLTANFGDYIDISAGGNRTYAGWADGRFGDPDVFFSELRGIGKAPNFAQR